VPAFDTSLHRYALGLGSNRCHGRFGRPTDVLRAAIVALGDAGLLVDAVSPIISSAPLGPSRRRYANAAVTIRTGLSPPELLQPLQSIEQAFGRRRARRWGERVLDIDILLWSGGAWHDPWLTIPHAAMAQRRFVLDPLRSIAADWRLGASPSRVRHAAFHLAKPHPAHASG
jgi:2-amino-4-hydroxy-6-hydroxymethyldihydropteridine diphosphokinase